MSVQVADARPCGTCQFTWQMPVQVADVSSGCRCQAMWHMSVHVADASSRGRCQCTWQMPVHVPAPVHVVKEQGNTFDFCFPGVENLKS